SAAALFGTFESSAALKRIPVKLGQNATVPCEMSYHQKIYWLRMGPEAQPKQLMVISLKNDGELTILHPSNDSKIHGCVLERFIGLRILRVAESDLGTYFCATYDQHMKFGEGVEIYTTQQSSEERVQNLTHNCGQAHSTFEEPDTSQAHMIIAVAMSIGLLIMVLTISFVHVKTSRRRVRRSNKTSDAGPPRNSSR
ncbi:hypothetical protein NFI96_026596, partial [Prochilodus magdalenae]